METKLDKMDRHPDDHKYKRITQAQLRYFITFAKKHPELMQTKAKTIHTKQHIAELWENLAEVLNDMHGPSRSPARWKDAMRNWKKQLRCRIKKAGYKNPEDTAMLEVFDITEFDQEACEIFGFVETEGPDCTNMQFEDECEIECKPIILPPLINETPAKEIFENVSPSSSKHLSTVIKKNSSSDDDDSNQSEDSTSPPKKKRKHSTQEMFNLVLESMKKREAREEKMVEALLKLGEGLLAVANAIALNK